MRDLIDINFDSNNSLLLKSLSRREEQIRSDAGVICSATTDVDGCNNINIAAIINNKSVNSDISTSFDYKKKNSSDNLSKTNKYLINIINNNNNININSGGGRVECANVIVFDPLNHKAFDNNSLNRLTKTVSLNSSIPSQIEKKKKTFNNNNNNINIAVNNNNSNNLRSNTNQLSRSLPNMAASKLNSGRKVNDTDTDTNLNTISVLRSSSSSGGDTMVNPDQGYYRQLSEDNIPYIDMPSTSTQKPQLLPYTSYVAQPNTIEMDEIFINHVDDLDLNDIDFLNSSFDTPKTPTAANRVNDNNPRNTKDVNNAKNAKKKYLSYRNSTIGNNQDVAEGGGGVGGDNHNGGDGGGVNAEYNLCSCFSFLRVRRNTSKFNVLIEV